MKNVAVLTEVRGICPLFSSPPRGIWQVMSPHPREFAIQGKKKEMKIPGGQPASIRKHIASFGRHLKNRTLLTADAITAFDHFLINCEATSLRSRLIQVAYVTSLGCLCPKPAPIHLFCLNFKYGSRNQGIFVCSQSIQKGNEKNTRSSIKWDVDWPKSGKVLFGIENNVFAREEYEFKWW